MLPLLIKPRYWAFRNRLRLARRSWRQLAREVVLLTFFLSIVGAVAQGTYALGREFRTGALTASLPPSIPLSVIFLSLLGLFVLSNTVTGISAVYLSKDLELLIASPITKWRLFWGKLFEVLLSSAWMGLVFGLPAAAGFGISYRAGPEFYLVIALATVPFVFICAALGIIIATLVVTILSLARPFAATVTLLVVATVGFLLLHERTTIPPPQSPEAEALLTAARALSLPHLPWLPSHWVSVWVGGMLQPESRPLVPYATLLWSSAAATVACAYLSLVVFHERGIAKMRAFGIRGPTTTVRPTRTRRIGIPSILPPQLRAVMGKEFRLFSRDMMQAFQLLLLLTLCFIYLYNFRMVGDTDALPLAMRGWWKAVLSLANIGTGSFVIGAISNRFVFPSVSLEGQNFWILQTSPMSTQEILRTKFLCWFIPLGLIATIVFLSGGLALQADPEVLIGSAVAGGIISYGIVGLAVGLGACFVKFDWEHVSQLGASVGSLVFMGACAILVMIDVLPCALLLFFRVMHDSSATLTAEQWFVSAASVTLLLLWINVSITRWALRIGAQQLEEKTNG